ncbi:DNA-methyltransferase [Enterococcus sp. AZ126]|uniref:DNA-methyltransferase n=1 Tax=Enterococcus sp. AZ126 TaxID=2774635 RepID=UPI003F1F060C
MDKRNEKIEIINGDAMTEIKKLSDDSINLIIADPPYNLSKDYISTKDNMEFNEYINFSKAWLSEVKRVLKPNGTMYIFMGFRFISYLYSIMEQDLDLHFNSWITWHYTQGIGKTKGFSPRHDDILMFTKTEKFQFNIDDIRVPQKFYRSRNNMRGANPGNVWKYSHVHYSNPNRQPHPTQKPEGLIERMILASSNENDIVLDPFLGSGTTARVCQQLNRRCIGFEVEKEYTDMTKERLSSVFNGFDSIDERLLRVPNDLNDSNIRFDYLQNHLDWFLSKHLNRLPDFILEYLDKYEKKITLPEIEFIQELTFPADSAGKKVKSRLNNIYLNSTKKIPKAEQNELFT